MATSSQEFVCLHNWETGEGEKGRVWPTDATVPSPLQEPKRLSQISPLTAQLEGLCFLVISQGTAAVPALREVRSPGWNLAQRCALSKERWRPNRVGLCKETVAPKDTWDSCNILYGQTTGYSHPQTLILPSTCYPLSVWAPICCIHLVQGKESYHCWEEESFLLLSNTSAQRDTSPRLHGQEDRWPVSSSWHPRPSVCCHCFRSPASGCQLTRRSDTQPRRALSAMSGTWCEGGTKKLLEEQASRFVPNLPLPNLHVSSLPVSKQARSRDAQHIPSQHTQGSQLLYSIHRWFSLSKKSSQMGSEPSRGQRALHLNSSAKKPLSSRQHYSRTIQTCPPSLWLSSLDLEGLLKLLTWTQAHQYKGKTREGPLPQRAHQRSSRRLKAGLQEHPNTNSTICNYKNLHHPEQAVLWHRNCLNWVSLQRATHTSSGGQPSGTSHPTTAVPAPENRPCSRQHVPHECQAVLWLGDSGVACTQPSRDPITQEEPDKGHPKGRERQRQQNYFAWVQATEMLNTPGSCWQWPWGPFLRNLCITGRHHTSTNSVTEQTNSLSCPTIPELYGLVKGSTSY